MRPATTAITDPLWQCLCPSWTQHSLAKASRLLSKSPTTPQCLNSPRNAMIHSSSIRQNTTEIRHHAAGNYNYDPDEVARPPRSVPWIKRDLNIKEEPTASLYGVLQSASVHNHVSLSRDIAEHLVKERGEKPSTRIYNALILCNVHHKEGAAWRVHHLLEELREEGLEPDNGTCHAVLKVLSVHPDHLLRTDILDYMQKRWFQLSEDGAHDVAAGLLREGLFEQALQRLDEMKASMFVDGWLWDMAVYTLCDAGEVDEAFRIMRTRFDSGEMKISRSLWSYLLDKASESRHHDATALVWNSQVNQEYLNPSSGVCLNVLSTAAHAGDAIMGTEVFSHLSKRATAFEPIHYELLISTYLAANPPDLKRAMSILTVMPMEKLEPSIAETRPLYVYLRDKPALLNEAFSIARELHEEDRIIPIALLNLLIECHVEQRNLLEAMKIYKLIHTFVPANKGPNKSFANVDTFNLLLKGCRTANPPDESQASFLVSELLALRIIPTALTYDRIILVFLEASKAAFRNAATLQNDQQVKNEFAKGKELLDWAFRHFVEMQPLEWMPRFGTIERLGIELAKQRDPRCWDVLQMAEDGSSRIDSYAQKGKWVKLNIEQAWEEAAPSQDSVMTATASP